MFDGQNKHDTSKRKHVINGTVCTKTVGVLARKPESYYLHHLTLEIGIGAAVAVGPYNAVEKTGIADKIIAVGADCMAVNRRNRNGATGHFKQKQEYQLMLTNPRDAVRR